MKESGDLVSIIMPTYNSSEFVEDSIRSVMSQTYTDWELLVTDDYSADNTMEILSELAAGDERIHIDQLPENGGPAAARNNSIKKAHGRFLAFLDSDDIWYPTKLQRQVDHLHHSHCRISFTSYQPIDESSRPIGKIVKSKAIVTRKDLFFANYIGCSTAVVKLDGSPPLMPDIRKRQDYGYWYELLRHGGKACGLEEVLVNYRKRSNSVSSSKPKLISYQWQLYRQVMRWNALQSMLALFSWAFFSFTGLKNRGI